MKRYHHFPRIFGITLIIAATTMLMATPSAGQDQNTDVQPQQASVDTPTNIRAVHHGDSTIIVWTEVPDSTVYQVMVDDRVIANTGGLSKSFPTDYLPDNTSFQVRATGAPNGRLSISDWSDPVQVDRPHESKQIPPKTEIVSDGRSSHQWASPPPMTIDPDTSYTAVLETTVGTITVELLSSEAPNTVNNFVFLTREGFYDNTIFHRTIPGFMIQGGDPTGKGKGGPGYRFADEPVARPYTRGVMAMANAGPDTNGSQFFIMHADYPLPPTYTIFGQVVAGLDAIDTIATAPRKAGGEGSSPMNPVTIQSVEIIGP